MRGVNLVEVKEFMGHADIATTMRYVHLAPDRLKEAARVSTSLHRSKSGPHTGHA